ncbi:hypothetical protein IU433_21190 [Nocardia puris]|uniref:LuxR C-terminal-related transcriptional regulator n=1 Tax=Nocardia puris TaxID=208602 RepID=UPI001893C451|nr:LuxR C-terminal-related transcriptional regulator [Nocardia puris]MBF6214074.1 hypothetical protein [Nocardia puris]MBF6368642.1 hypothetical protein [Nocardia puris]MBF6461544.1 hypothetical protein [Nocardia puris]
MASSHGPDLRTTRGSAALSPLPALSFAPITRPALLRRLDAIAESPRHRALLLCAPAGSGKTVLLTEWAGTRQVREVVWVALGEQPDGDGTLWSALREGLGMPAPQRALGAPGSEAAALVDALATRGDPLVIVLDDAHLITEPLELAGLEHFLLHAPPGVTTVISGRFDPPLRWHLPGLPEQLVRWGAEDLALDGGEVEALCREHGCDLDGAELDTVTALTRGWAALVRIAAIYLSTARDRAAALATLARPPHAVSDFLVGELISALAPSLRMFLTYTSVPAAFTERLADELTGGGAGHALYELDRMSFPLTSVVRDGDIWFAYHPMLRAYFLAEANRLDAGARGELHLRAARALRETGSHRQAVTHLLSVPDPAHLHEYLAERGVALVLEGDGPAVFDELHRRLPTALDDPFVWLLRVLDALFHGSTADARNLLDVADARRSAHPSFAPPDWVDALAVAVTADLFAASGARLGEVSTAAPAVTGHPDIDGYLAIQSATALLVEGHPHRAEERLLGALTLANHTGHPRLALRALTRLAFVATARDATASMRERADRALAVASEHHLTGTTDAAQVMAISALAAHLRGEVPDARHLDGALAARTGQDGSHSPLAGWHGHTIALMVDAARCGHRPAAVDALRHTTHLLLDERPVPAATATLVAQVVAALLNAGEARPAHLLANRAHRQFGDLPDLTVARAMLADAAEHDQAVLGAIEPLLGILDALHARTAVVAWLLYASAQHRLGTTGKARGGLEQALRRAEPDHLVRPFLDVPAAIELLDVYSGRLGRRDAFADLVRRHPSAHHGHTRPGLTDAETTVLQHLPSGRTAQQIAEDLGVSINTVKTHMRAIYTKFGTNSRVAALDHARRSGLL